MVASFETERLRLRPFTPADLERLVELHGDAEVMRYVTGTPTPREVVERTVLPRFLRHDQCRPALGVWAAEEREGGAFVGWFSLKRRPGAGNLEAELGYRLARAAWGQGYATEGARALVARAFALGMRRVVANVYEENLASRRVLEKLGMTLVRRFKPTPEALARGVTFEPAPTEVWDGDELEYALQVGASGPPAAGRTRRAARRPAG